MWAYGHYFRTENVDDGHMTQEYGVEVEFDQSSQASYHELNLVGVTYVTSKRYKRSLKRTALLSNVLFLGSCRGTPLIGIM